MTDLHTFEFKQSPLYYLDQGNGKTLIFIHGFLENHSMWKNCISYFSKHCRCVAPDLFGHGETPAHGYIHSMKTYASAVAQLITHLQIQEYAVIGHSMGGYVALELLQLQAQQITQLVLLNSTPLPDSTEKKIIRDRAIRAIQQMPDAFIQMAVKNLFLPEDHIRLKNEIKQAILEAKKCSHQGIIATLHGLKERADHQETLAKAKCNTLVIAGKKDNIAPYQQLKNSLKGSSAKLLSLNGGHMSYLEFPKEVNLALSNFLSVG